MAAIAAELFPDLAADAAWLSALPTAGETAAVAGMAAISAAVAIPRGNIETRALGFMDVLLA
jgi:hypothetical protein